jgi:hypothetical protein
MPKVRRWCNAKSSQSGNPCQRAPIQGGAVCYTHGGAAPQVKKAAAKRLLHMLKEVADPDRVMEEAGCLAFSNITELYDTETGKLLPMSKWPEHAARAVKSIEVVRGNVDKGDGQFDEVVKIQLWDKPRKVENIMKHHGKLTEKLDVTLSDSRADRVLAARSRVDGKRS